VVIVADEESRDGLTTQLVEVLGIGLVALGFEGFPMPLAPEPPAVRKSHRPRTPQ
jgi:hypothetical protein